MVPPAATERLGGHDIHSMTLDATKLNDPQISASKTILRLLVSFASYMTRSSETVMDMITPCQSGLLNASQILAHVSGLSGMVGIRITPSRGD